MDSVKFCFTSRLGEEGGCITAYAECIRGMAGGVGGGEGNSRWVVGGDGCVHGTEVGGTFKVPEKSDSVGTVGCRGVSVFGAEVDDFIAAVSAEEDVEQ